VEIMTVLRGLKRHAARTEVSALNDLKTRAEAVGAIAAREAAIVDREARFPAAAIENARAQALMGILVPRELGGEGSKLSEVADVCYRLGRACASTGLIYSMHQSAVACLVRHARKNEWHAHLLQRIAGEQLLVASSTTEGQSGGNVRSSAAAVERDGSRIALTRAATVISYGAEADAIVTTARRSAEATSSDQVLVAFLKKDYTLEPVVSWDTLGMRGTCSTGFTLKAAGVSDQILPEPYERIHAQTLVPTAHLLWASVWNGIAAAAVERAQSFIRKAARQANGELPPGTPHFTKASSSLRLLRSMLVSALTHYEAVSNDARTLSSLDFQTAFNLVKVDASELAVATVLSALRACGLSGYRIDGDFTIGRYLRDVLSAPIMINNDRILANIVNLALMSGVPTSLLD
jgi:acyl-CoA dehydrogenase